MVNLDIPEVPELTFDEKKHIYKVNGSYLPSVTTVLKPLSESFYRGIDEGVLNTAAERGTAIHNAIENFVRFEIEDIDPAFRGYFDGFLRWWEREKPVSIATERRIYHKYMRYAGTADMPCVIGGKLTCVDFKSSAQVVEMLCRPQLEAYARAFDSFGYKFDQKAIVHLKRDGNYAMEVYKANDTEAWEVFGASLTLWGYQQKFKRR